MNRRLNLYIGDELHKRLRVHCAVEDKDMSEVVRKLIEEYLQKVEKKTTKKQA
jgi:ribbon-helix-helix protein